MHSVYHPFPSTHWSLVRRAGTADENSRRDALAVLLARYEPALRSYLRVVRRLPSDDARDLLQSFIADKLLEQQLLRHADESRGRFRTFLLTSLKNFAVSRQRAEDARPAQSAAQSPEELAVPQPASAAAPPAYLEAEWSRALVHHVIEAMRDECTRIGRVEVWTVFDQRVLAVIFREAHPVSYDALSAELHLESPMQAANLLVTAKRMYARLLRVAVGEYERSEAGVDEEIADLHRVLTTPPR